MKTLSRILLVGIVLVLFSEGASAVNIRGFRSCGVWAAEREKSNVRGHESWLTGFLSGLAVAAKKEFWGRPNIDLIDNESVYLWMDNYCRANPLKDISDGGIELFIERAIGK